MTAPDVVVTPTVNVVGICVLVDVCSGTVIAAVVAVDAAWLSVVESSAVVVCDAVEVNTFTVGVTLGSSDDVAEDVYGVVGVCEVVVEPASVVDVATTVNVVGISVVVVGDCSDSVVTATVDVAIVVDVSTSVVVVCGKVVVVGVSVVVVVTAAVAVAVEVKDVESVCGTVGEEFSAVEVSSTVDVDSVCVVVDDCSGKCVAVTSDVVCL